MLRHRTKRHTPLRLRVGEIVEVRSRDEILATLDEHGAIDGLPLMPEMLDYCGQRFTVLKRADKTCDTIAQSGMRRMTDAVHLDATRCTGAAHGGCQAACQIFWKEAWLKRADALGRPRNRRELPVMTVISEEQLNSATQREPNEAGETCYRCQATELVRATTPLARWSVMQHVRDLRSGNVTLGEIIKVSLWWFLRLLREHAPGYRVQVWLFNSVQRFRGGAQLFDLPGPQKQTPSERLDLTADEWVEVKSAEEIRATLDPAQKNRGLYFDREMLPYCGGKYRVRGRVSRIIDEKSGRMIKIPGSCVILDNVVCTGRYHMSCPRAIFPYWREIWLRRANELEQALASGDLSALPVPTKDMPRGGVTCGA